MKKDDLGTRMKEYEKCYNFKLTKRAPVILRIDGKAFHTMVKKWKCEKPFDEKLIETMMNVTKYLCENISGCEIGYVQSDEISLLLRNNQTLNTQPWFDNKLQKICSITASMATRMFNTCQWIAENPAMFDCRVFVLPEDEVCNYFIWRQQDASRNSVQMLARSMYSHRECNNKNCDELQEMCFLKDQNWNNLNTYKRRGSCVVKVLKEIATPSGEMITRNKFEIDYEIPVFTQDRDYINRRII